MWITLSAMAIEKARLLYKENRQKKCSSKFYTCQIGGIVILWVGATF